MPDVFVAAKKNPPPQPAETEPTTTLLSSFCLDPADVSFQTQEDDERVLLFTRRHVVTNIPWLLFFFALIAIPFFFPLFFPMSAFPLAFLPPRFAPFALALYYLICVAFAFVNFLTWYYNIGIVTNKRVVDVDFSDIVYHDVAQTKLSLIDDVNYTQSGVLRTLFNYGDVFIQTAGGKENLEMLAIPKPSQAVEIVANLMGERAHAS